MLGDIFNYAKEQSLDPKRHLEFTSYIASLVRPLVDSLDVAVSERAMDLLSRIDDSYDVTILERRKIAMVIDEVNGLLRDVVHHVKKELPLELQHESVIMDCY